MPGITIARALLAIVAAAAMGGVAGYSHGLRVERGHHAIDMQAAIVAAAEDARAHAAAESERRQAAALQAERAAFVAREARLRGLLNAAQQEERPGCAWPADRRLHINAAVDAANGRRPAAPGGVHVELPSDSRAAR